MRGTTTPAPALRCTGCLSARTCRSRSAGVSKRLPQTGHVYSDRTTLSSDKEAITPSDAMAAGGGGPETTFEEETITPSDVDAGETTGAAAAGGGASNTPGAALAGAGAGCTIAAAGAAGAGAGWAAAATGGATAGAGSRKAVILTEPRTGYSAAEKRACGGDGLSEGSCSRSAPPSCNRSRCSSMRATAGGSVISSTSKKRCQTLVIEASEYTGTRSVSSRSGVKYDRET